jgi:hypothetical protein
MMIPFKPKNFRQLSGDSPTGLRTNRGMTLILIKATGEASWGHTSSDKDTIVGQFEDSTDLLMLAWTGQRRTDIFRLTRADLDLRYR